MHVENCELVDVKTPVKVEKPVCSLTGTVPYLTIVPQTEHEMVYTMKCEVKKKVSCIIETKEECKTIDYIESEQKSHKTCEPTNVHIPKQTVDHKKKCLNN